MSVSALSGVSSLTTTSRWSGDLYRQNSGPQHQWATNNLARVVVDPRTASDDDSAVYRILDLGCGDGRVTVSLLDRWRDQLGSDTRVSVVGVDVEQAQIEHAKGEHKGAIAERDLKFYVGDARKLVTLLQEEVKQGGMFDLCVSNTAMHWVKEVDVALAQTAALLRPTTGRLQWTFVWSERSATQECFERVARQARFSKYFQSNGELLKPCTWFMKGWKDDLVPAIPSSPSGSETSEAERLLVTGWLDACDMDLISCDVVEVVDWFDSEDRLRGYIAQWSPHVHAIKDDVDNESGEGSGAPSETVEQDRDHYLNELMRELKAVVVTRKQSNVEAEGATSCDKEIGYAFSHLIIGAKKR